MISVSGRSWEQKKINYKNVEKIKQDYNFSNILAQLVTFRQFDEAELTSIENNLFLKNIFSKNKDFYNSVELVAKSIKNKDKVCILGDYDVDGSAATSLFIRYFESIKHPFFFYIPDREKDGYGASKKLIEKLILKKPKLVIMVDCGSSSNEAVSLLNKNKIKSLIIDHHEIIKPFPKANMIINPKKNNGYIEYDYLCATTLVYFFLDLLSQKIICKFKISDFLIYVLLATVCDVMPIRKFNRLIAITVLKNFKIDHNLAIKEIFNLSNKKKKLNINDIGYLIGPILNAGGRLGKSNHAANLLSSNNLKDIKNLSKELIKLNDRRKKIETLIINEIDFDKIKKEDNSVIIYYNSNINEGLIGIIAARLKDFFNKPSIVITNSNNILKGSARSISNYNIGRTVKNAVSKNILINGGGHNNAAGFTLKKDRLKIFKNFLINDFSKSNIIKDNIFRYDGEISSISFQKNFYQEIQKLEPFGIGNSIPTFLLKDLKVIKSSILKNKHISLIFKSRTGLSIRGISFDSVNSHIGEYLINYKKNLNLIAQINENYWNNKKILQLIVKDVII